MLWGWGFLTEPQRGQSPSLSVKLLAFHSYTPWSWGGGTGVAPNYSTTDPTFVTKVQFPLNKCFSVFSASG